MTLVSSYSIQVSSAVQLNYFCRIGDSILDSVWTKLGEIYILTLQYWYICNYNFTHTVNYKIHNLKDEVLKLFVKSKLLIRIWLYVKKSHSSEKLYSLRWDSPFDCMSTKFMTTFRVKLCIIIYTIFSSKNETLKLEAEKRNKILKLHLQKVPSREVIAVTF